MRTRGRWLGLAPLLLIATGGFAFATACLEDLRPFPAAPEAGNAPVAPAFGCGDGVIFTFEDGGDAGESCDPGESPAIGCEKCQITCSGNLDKETGHCYFWADPQTTFVAASEACRGAAGHVVTFANDREADFVATFAPDGGYWIGLAQDNTLGGYTPKFGPNEPGWPTSGKVCSGCFARDDAGGFADGEDGGLLDCLVATSDEWHRVSCNGSTSRSTLCEREPVGQRIYVCGNTLCTNLFINATTKRYVIWQFPTKAKTAAETCRTSYDGGHLVMFDSAEEREQLVNELVQRLEVPAAGLDFWIGLSLENGVWTWDDGEAIDAGEADGGRPPPWGEGEPGAGVGQAFVFINQPDFLSRIDSQLTRTDKDVSSEKERLFICQRPPE